MKERHSCYYEYGAKECVRRYKRKLRMNAAVGLVLLLLLFAGICTPTVSKNKQFLDFVFLLLMALVVTAQKMRRQHIATHLLQVLYMDCDPIKAVEIINLIEKHVRRESAMAVWELFKAQAYSYIAGKEENGFACLCRIRYPMKAFGTELVRLSLHLGYYMKKEDWENFERVKQDLINMSARVEGKSAQGKVYYEYLENVKLLEWMRDGKNDEAETYIEEQLKRPNHLLNRTTFHMYLAKLYMQDGENGRAKEHLRFVVEHGNTVCYVQQAKEMLAECN